MIRTSYKSEVITETIGCYFFEYVSFVVPTDAGHIRLLNELFNFRGQDLVDTATPLCELVELSKAFLNGLSHVTSMPQVLITQSIAILAEIRHDI